MSATLGLVISQRRQTGINTVNNFTFDDSELLLPKQVVDLTRLWSTMSPEGRQALLGFARLQASAAASSMPFATQRLH
jgi:hypothetical protein